MLSVPFGSAALNVSLRFKYDSAGFELYLAGELISRFKFCLSVARDISAIEAALDTFLTENPQYVTFYKDVMGGNNQITIPDGDAIICHHIQAWCKYWNINITEFDTLKQIIDKFGNDTEPLTFRVSDEYFGQSTSTSTSTITNYDNFITGENNIELNNTSVTTSFNTSTKKYMLAPIFNMNSYIHINQMTPTAFSDIEQSINENEVVRTTLPLYIFRSKLVPLLALKYINPKLQYILGDILNMSKRKYSHFILCLNKVFTMTNYNIGAMYGLDIDSLCKDMLNDMTNDNPAMYSFFHERGYVITEIINAIPKFIDDFPFEQEQFAIPNISAIPQTSLQWMMTNIIAKKEIKFTRYLKQHDLSVIKDVKKNTRILLNAIHIPTKALGMFLKYRHALNDDGMFTDTVYQDASETLYEYGMCETELNHQCKKMLEFIADGKRIFDEYPEPVDLGELGILKMAPINGTYLKQMRNSIYNHRMENKVALDYKLQQLRKDGKDNNDMICNVELSPELEECRIKFKDEMILLGSTLKHCLGNYTTSSDLFFRKESVCAQIRMPDFKLGQCYDRGNQSTVESKEFGEWLLLSIDMWCARNHHEEITEATGIGLDDFDEHIPLIRDVVQTMNLIGRVEFINNEIEDVMVGNCI